MWSNRRCPGRPSLVGLAAMVLLAVSTSSVVLVGAGCLKESRLCCDGKNNTCRREGARVTNNESFTCFCDSVCNQLGDCCTDYKQACQAVDCVLSSDHWSDWAPCDVTCGVGFRRRRRTAVQPALNGGKDCEQVVETVPCDAGPCRAPDEKSRDDGGSSEIDVDDVELAKIIPVTEDSGFSTTALLYLDQNTLSSSSSSSSPPEVVRRHHSRRNGNHDDGNHGNDASSHDDGALGNADVAQRKRGDTKYFAVFHLTDVRSACHVTSSQPLVTMTKGTSVCVECRALSVRRRLRNQCKGHGTTSRETRWVTLTIPGCHGKWILSRPPGRGSCRDAGLELGFTFA